MSTSVLLKDALANLPEETANQPIAGFVLIVATANSLDKVMAQVTRYGITKEGARELLAGLYEHEDDLDA